MMIMYVSCLGELKSMFSNLDYQSAFSLILSVDTMAIINIIRSHYNVVWDIKEFRLYRIDL